MKVLTIWFKHLWKQGIGCCIKQGLTHSFIFTKVYLPLSKPSIIFVLMVFLFLLSIKYQYWCVPPTVPYCTDFKFKLREKFSITYKFDCGWEYSSQFVRSRLLGNSVQHTVVKIFSCRPFYWRVQNLSDWDHVIFALCAIYIGLIYATIKFWFSIFSILSDDNLRIMSACCFEGC